MPRTSGLLLVHLSCAFGVFGLALNATLVAFALSRREAPAKRLVLGCHACAQALYLYAAWLRPPGTGAPGSPSS